MKFVRLADHSILLSAIPPGSTVIDAGFNEGAFSRALLAEVDCRIIALEPVPELVADATPHRSITLLSKALAAASGERPFHEYDGNCASLHLHYDRKARAKSLVKAISLHELFSSFEIERLALLKMDIEGEEIDVLLKLGDEILYKIDQITVEFHLSHFPDHLNIYKELITRLRAAGFVHCNFSTRAGTDSLFLRREHIDSLAPGLVLASARYRLGLQRIMERILPQVGMRATRP